MPDMKKKPPTTHNLDGSEQKTFVLPNPRIIATITPKPDGTTQAELTDYGKEVFSRFSEDFLDRANAQFDDIREQHKRRLEAEEAIDNP